MKALIARIENNEIPSFLITRWLAKSETKHPLAAAKHAIIQMKIAMICFVIMISDLFWWAYVGASTTSIFIFLISAVTGLIVEKFRSSNQQNALQFKSDLEDLEEVIKMKCVSSKPLIEWTSPEIDELLKGDFTEFMNRHGSDSEIISEWSALQQAQQAF